jgi:AAA15 family ATPase/GTPase
MLMEFRTANHRSIRDEQVLSMTAAPLGDVDDLRPRVVEGCAEKLLPVAVLYGANASGKSNLLSAIAYMRDAIVLNVGAG